MKKNLLIFVTLIVIVFLSGCAIRKINSYNKTLESMVTCNTEDKGVPFLGYLIKNEKEGFTKTPKNPNFYTSDAPYKVFGHKIKYVGLNGVEMKVGPNISVAGKQNEVINKISETTGLNFTCSENNCYHQINEDMFVLVYPHQTEPTLTTIQCYMKNLSY